MRERRWTPQPPGPAGRRRRREHGGAGRPNRNFRPRPHAADGPALLYGWHTVKAALENPHRRFRRALATENAARSPAHDGVEMPLTPELVRPDAIAAQLPPDAVHQGLLAEADALESPPIEDLPAEGIVLALDQITDPHNVGAILRSAAGFGVNAVVMTARHSPEATGVLAKSASGALEHVPIAEVGNLARALEALEKRGFLLIGLDSSGTAEFAALPLASPLALVVGAEGKGLRQLTRTTCHQVARLDLPGTIKDLNVSNAAALALYIATTRLKGTTIT